MNTKNDGLAMYLNTDNNVVIRGIANDCEQDSVVIIDRLCLHAVIARLEELQQESLA